MPKDVYVSQSDGGGKSVVFEFGAQNVQNAGPKCAIKGLRDVLGWSDAFTTDSARRWKPPMRRSFK